MSEEEKKNKIIPKTTKLSYEDLEKAIGVNLADKWKEQTEIRQLRNKLGSSVIRICDSVYEDYDEKDKQIPNAQMEWCKNQGWYWERYSKIKETTGLPDVILDHIIIPYSTDIYQEFTERVFKINENRTFTENIVNEFRIIYMEKFDRAKYEAIEKNKKLVIGQSNYIFSTQPWNDKRLQSGMTIDNIYFSGQQQLTKRTSIGYLGFILNKQVSRNL